MSNERLSKKHSSWEVTLKKTSELCQYVSLNSPRKAVSSVLSQKFLLNTFTKLERIANFNSYLKKKQKTNTEYSKIKGS